MSTISIIIPCKDDERLRDCVASIDDTAVEVVIALNGSSRAVERIVDEYRKVNSNTAVVNLAAPNLAAALEDGSRAASSEYLLYMDSDCCFEKGAIQSFRRALLEHEVVKGHILFESNSLFSGIIARSREHHTAEQITAYKPPLAIRSSIRERIGGYFFDSRLMWREDSDLDWRIRRAGIPIHFAADAIIRHPPLALLQDLRSAARYGIGLARAEHYNIPLTEVPRSIWSTFRSKGLTPAAYMVLRNTIYNCGYLFEHAKLSQTIS